VADGGPLLLLAGGSGLVPLMAMLRHRAAQGSEVPTDVLISSRGWDDVLYRGELAELTGDAGLVISYTLTRKRPDGWTGFARRVDAEMLTAVAPPPSAQPQTFVCGPTPFVEHVADALVALGYGPATIRAERFGPTG
jgi:ferredoxin-NADP reductase